MTKRPRVVLSVDGLEERALLSAAPAHLARPVTAEVGSLHEARARSSTVVVLQGQATGMLHGVVTPNAAGINTLILASGPVRGIPGGAALSSIQETEIHGNQVRVTLGSGSLKPVSATPGSLLTFAYSGSGPVARTGATQRFSISGAVTGGQGVYAGASGNFAGTVVVNPQTGTLTIRYTIQVRLIKK